MSTTEVVTLLIASAGGLSGLAAILRVRLDRRQGVSSNEQTARRDTIADRDAFLQMLLGEMKELKKQQEEDRRRMNKLLQYVDALEDHIDSLEHQFWEMHIPLPKSRPPRDF